MAKITRPYINVKQANRKFILTTLPARVLAKITYTAVRGKDSEVGAVQRVLTSRRIESVKEFVLKGGDLPGAIVLNWQKPLVKEKGNLIIQISENLAQVIDGQHRVAGLSAALEEDSKWMSIQIPVVIYEQLTTEACADIFLSINTQQKTVARSLVYDLYGISSELIADKAIIRARDIAEHFNLDENSPYFSRIKFPGEKRRRGGIALSSAVTAIKELVVHNGSLEQVGIVELEVQIKCILNFFTALERRYGTEWDSKDNVFLYAAGFTAACQFFKLSLIPYCKTQSSFEISSIQKTLNFKKLGLIVQSEVKGQSGGEAVKIIYSRLQESFTPKKSANKLKF